jgi:hypothetical protein
LKAALARLKSSFFPQRHIRPHCCPARRLSGHGCWYGDWGVMVQLEQSNNNSRCGIANHVFPL